MNELSDISVRFEVIPNTEEELGYFREDSICSFYLKAAKDDYVIIELPISEVRQFCQNIVRDLEGRS